MTDVERIRCGCYNRGRSTRFQRWFGSLRLPTQSAGSERCSQLAQRVRKCGQVAQVVERSPEKAGVGGSTPSLATIIPKDLAALSRNFQPTIQPTIRRFDPRFLTEPS